MKAILESTKRGASHTHKDGIEAYSAAQPPELRAVCERLRDLIERALPDASAKVWHGSPVWFIGENPVVGYAARANAVNLLFWNGQSLGESALKPVGKYRAAERAFATLSQVQEEAVRRWLRKAGSDVFDSKAYFKKLREEKKRESSSTPTRRTL